MDMVWIAWNSARHGWIWTDSADMDSRSWNCISGGNLAGRATDMTAAPAGSSPETWWSVAWYNMNIVALALSAAAADLELPRRPAS